MITPVTFHVLFPMSSIFGMEIFDPAHGFALYDPTTTPRIRASLPLSCRAPLTKAVSFRRYRTLTLLPGWPHQWHLHQPCLSILVLRPYLGHSMYRALANPSAHLLAYSSPDLTLTMFAPSRIPYCLLFLLLYSFLDSTTTLMI